jgi:membrane protein
VLLFPAGLYGEGLRRALLQMAPGEADLWTGWKGRGALLAAAAAGPPLVLLLLATAPVIAPLYAAGGWSLLGGIAIAFHAVLAVTTVGLVLVYRVVAPGTLPWRAVLLSAFATGAVLAGFLQGFVLFLAIPIEWSLPFGGLPVFGAVAALALWLYLLHVLLLLGYGVARWLAHHRLADVAVTVRRGRARSRHRPG